MNIKLFDKVKETIREEPMRLRMSMYIDKGVAGFARHALHGSYGESASYTFPACGTVGCVAGWAVVINRGIKVAMEKYLDCDDLAAEDLEMPNHRLFFPDDWPRTLGARYKIAQSQEERVELVCEAIDSYIATDGWRQLDE